MCRFKKEIGNPRMNAVQLFTKCKLYLYYNGT